MVVSSCLDAAASGCLAAATTTVGPAAAAGTVAEAGAGLDFAGAGGTEPGGGPRLGRELMSGFLPSSKWLTGCCDFRRMESKSTTSGICRVHAAENGGKCDSDAIENTVGMDRVPPPLA